MPQQAMRVHSAHVIQITQLSTTVVRSVWLIGGSMGDRMILSNRPKSLSSYLSGPAYHDAQLPFPS